ncbi:MAG: hypothetical protein RIT27_2296 [Pseudomonadota bacterium]
MISKTLQYSLLGLAGLVIINASLAFQMISSPTPKSNALPVADNWQMSELQQPTDYKAFFEVIRQKKAWREPPPPPPPPPTGTPPPPPPVKPAAPPKPEIVRDWEIRGIVKENKTRFVLILDKEKKIKRYAKLDELPDGSIIETINDNMIEIVQNGTPETICLYLQNPR